MEKLIERFLDKKNIFAVVGVSRNPEKYGYRVYKDLKQAGYTVYPINPKADMIDDDRCYNSLRRLPKRPDVVDIVVPPNITEEVVKECKELGIKKVWMQPGSESKKAIDFCENNHIEIISNACVMVERRKT